MNNKILINIQTDGTASLSCDSPADALEILRSLNSNVAKAPVEKKVSSPFVSSASHATKKNKSKRFTNHWTEEEIKLLLSFRDKEPKEAYGCKALRERHSKGSIGVYFQEIKKGGGPGKNKFPHLYKNNALSQSPASAYTPNTSRVTVTGHNGSATVFNPQARVSNYD